MKRALNLYCRFLKAALTALMAVMIVPVLMQIVSRHTGVIPRYIWTEEAARFCFVWIIMIGSMIAVREGTHFYVDLTPQPKTAKGQGFVRLITHGFMALLALVFAWHGAAFAKLGYQQTSEMSGVNMLAIYISFPIAGLSWLVFLVEKIAADLKLIDAVEQEA